MFGMFNSSVKLVLIVVSDDNYEKGFVMCSEMKIIFNDDKKLVMIEILVGKIFMMDEDKGIIKFEDEYKNVLMMDDKGIFVEMVGELKMKVLKDVSIEGMNINIKVSV